jgi:hypothetical protein
MKENISKRFLELTKEGDELIRRFDLRSGIDNRYIPEVQTWLTSSSHLIKMVVRKDSQYKEEVERLMNHEYMKSGIPGFIVSKMHGVLKSAHKEWEGGMLREIEYIIAAENFDNFLDHASFYHKGDKKIESSILASAVLEDTMKKIGTKNGVPTKGLSLDQITDELVKADLLTQVKAKRVKAYAGVRNHALHAEWDDFDIKDVGEMIKGIRELIEDNL